MNSGLMRFPVTISYILSSLVDDMGSYNPTFQDYSVVADFVEVNDAQRINLGMNIEENAYKVTCRIPVEGRPVKLVKDNVTYRVTSCKFNRLGNVIEMIVVNAN